MAFKWMAALKIGYKVLDEAGKHGLKIKGVPIAEVEQKVAAVVSSSRTLVDVFKRRS